MKLFKCHALGSQVTMRPVLAIVVIVLALGSVRAYISFVGPVTGRAFAPIQDRVSIAVEKARKVA